MTGTESTPAAERPAEVLPAEAVEQSSVALMRVIERAALDPSFDVEKLSRLLDVKERWDREEARKAYHAALAAFKAAPPTITKNRHVAFTSRRTGEVTEYDHATLDEVVYKLVPALAQHGLSHAWGTEQLEGGRLKVTCKLTHRDGYSEAVSLAGPPDDSGHKNAIQQSASAISYLERYTLLAITGLAASGEDDDGRSTGNGDQHETISVEQIAKLNAKIEETGAELAGFLKFCRVDAIEDLPAWKFPGAMQALEDRAKRVAAEGAQDAGEAE